MPTKPRVFGSQQKLRRFEAKRQTTTQLGYGGDWQRCRLSQLRQKPLCELCDRAGRITVATVVHHKKHVETHPELRLDPENLMSLCRECHEQLHGRYKGPLPTGTLIVLCGPSHSGKSTYAAKTSAATISSDAIREQMGLQFGVDEPAVWREFSRQTYIELASGRDVIADACHLSKASLEAAIRSARGATTKCVVFETSRQEIIKRQQETGRWDRDTVLRMWFDFDKFNPSDRELLAIGFDAVERVRVKKTPSPKGRGDKDF